MNSSKEIIDFYLFLASIIHLGLVVVGLWEHDGGFVFWNIYAFLVILLSYAAGRTAWEGEKD